VGYGADYLQNASIGKSCSQNHGVIVEAADETALICVRPAPNANHKGTAFGGSLYSLAVLTAGPGSRAFSPAGNSDADAVIQESNMRFLAPVHGEMRACIENSAEADIDKLQRMLLRADRGRIRLLVNIHQGRGWQRFLTACLRQPCAASAGLRGGIVSGN